MLDLEVGAHLPLVLLVLEDVEAGEVGAIGGDVEAGLCAAHIQRDAAACGDDATPDVSCEGRGRRAGVAKTGVGELRVLDRVAVTEEGDGASKRTPLRAAGDVRDEELVGRVAQREAEVGGGQLQFAAEAARKLLRRRDWGICRQGAQDRDVPVEF